MNFSINPSFWRRSGLALMTAVGILTVAACGGGTVSQSTEAGYPMTVENCGRQVTIQEQPRSLYVIGGEAGTLVYAAGGVDLITAFSPLIGEPLGEAAEQLEGKKQFPIHTASEMSREVMIGEDPDLVVTFGLSGFGPEDLEAAGIPTYIINGYCGGFGSGQSTIEDPFEGVFDDIETLGRILGTEEQAKSAAAQLRERVDQVRERAAQTPPTDKRTAALYIAGPDSTLGAYGGRSMIHQQMEYVGLTNVYEDTDERYFETNVESFIHSAPERIIALYEPGDTTVEIARSVLTERPDLAAVPAVIDDNIMVLDFYYSGHGALAIEGLERLAELIGESY